MSAHKVIFDTDPGIDDAMALLFLHHHPAIDLIGITTVFGNGDIEVTTRNALYLKSLWQIAAPVARGAGQPFDPARQPRPAAAHVHGDNGLGNVDVPETVDVPLDPRSAGRQLFLHELPRCETRAFGVWPRGQNNQHVVGRGLRVDNGFYELAQ